ncbi:valyl-tRNA synthetase [Octadecabacter temperatus]|uniref:Valine--tRNA ligase n=1 Tax=Octadecabacter temperatus TaxID=1458307 RepID=A0A0K0Y370_9RHOB|nr:valine--tRNA ligase [Octadecabacter temperatus]AKS45395.1 Valine--tRNA ligase [Octadecabacter temperatus]SIN91997.1 valyl-tRNA synthetase [Octadecabacter temperatus]
MPMEKKFDASEAEARITERWLSGDAFVAGANAKRDDTYCVMIPPPNVTGVLHMGHAFNNTLQDILVRWHRMRGFDTLWQPGTDHAGIATQMVVERKLAENGEPKRVELGREKFLEKVWDWKAESGGQIINQLKRLGASCDWSREAFTMSGAPGAPADAQGNFHDAVIKVFVEMYNKGLIYRGKRLVNWDPHFETAISDLEVENIEVDGHMWHFKYPLAGGATYEYVEKDEDGNVILSETRNYISIATTRPETMLGDGAVAVNPKDERYAPIIGKLCEIPVGPKESRRLIPIITDDYPDMEFGSGAVKITGAHDFNDYMVAKRGGIPMYSLMDTKGAMRADGKPYVEEAATAQAIANGEQEFDEAMIAAMNLVPEAYRGMDRFEARDAVVADITAEGLAVMHDVTRTVKNDDGEKVEITETVPMVENKKIMQPFGDRSKVVIEPMLTDQWFVETDKIVKPALDAVKDGTVKILPESGEKTYYHWLENIEPWCISRQLWWGHQIPVWTAMVPTLDGQFGTWSIGVGEGISREKAKKFLDENKYDEEAMGGKLTAGGMLTMDFCAASVEEAQAQISKVWQERMNVVPQTFAELEGDPGDWYQNQDLVLPDDSGYQAIPMWRDPDVLDTWFSSGLWPIGTLGWPEETDELAKYFPTSDLITGQDILFFWVARMMMMQLAVVDQIPFDTIYLHGLVRDAKGKKMSKSTGNVIDPLDIINEYGADALRFTNAAMASLGGALKLDTQRIAGYRNFGTKLWNACRFAEMNGAFGQDAVYTQSIQDIYAINTTQSVNKWIIGETTRALTDVNAALDSYRFNDAADTLYKFVWGKVCDWYVELSKPLLMDGSDAEKQETQAVMNWVLNQCLILMHPIMPFITEELWALDGNETLLTHQDWPEYGADLIDEVADAEMSWVIQAIENIRSTRAQMNVPAGLYVPLIQTEADDAAKTAWANNEALIKRLARVDDLAVGDAPKGSMMVGTKGATFALPLADIIDVDAEKARITKSLGKVEKEAGGLRGRLGNPKFAENATVEVVAEAKANLALREEEIAQLTAALAQLNEI